MPVSSSSARRSNFVEPLEGRRLLSGGGAPLFVPPTPVTRVPPVNGGFEDFPDFTGWQTVGNDTILDQNFVTPPEGKAQAGISNGGATAVDAATLSSFLGLKSAKELKTHDKAAVNGSAIKQTITAKAFDILSFKADFLTNEVKRGGDYGFVTLTFNGKTELFKLSDFTHATSPLTFASTSFAKETGYQTYALILPKAGQYTIGYGVVNVGDGLVASELLVDNVQLTPFPIILKHSNGRGHSPDDDSDSSNSVLND